MESMDRPVCGGVHKSVPEREACGMYVKGLIREANVDMLIDSGANISIVDYGVYMHMERGKPDLRRYGTPMVTADGTPMKVYGCADFELEIGDEICKYQHNMCIADIGVEVILGYDFLKDFEAIIDMGRSIIELKDEGSGEASGGDARMNECNIIIGRTIVVPAGGEAIAQGYCVNNESVFTGMLEATERFQQKKCMMVACAVVRTGVWGVPVRIFNAGDKPITIYNKGNQRLEDPSALQ